MNNPVKGIKERKSLVSDLQGVFLCMLTSVSAEFLFRVLPGEVDLLFSFGRITLLFLCILTLHRFSISALKFYKPSFKDLLTLHIILIASMLIIGLATLFVFALANYSQGFEFIPEIPNSALVYAVPFAVGGLLIQSVLGLHYGLVLAIFLTTIVSIYFANDQSWLLPLFVLISNLVACLSLRQIRSRSAYLKAGLQISLLLVPFAFASSFVENSPTNAECFYRVVSSFLGGFLSVFLATGLTPLVEYLGGYVTDIRLIEMATLDHPLLKELSVQAPGTWNHSMVMGMMVESAAQEIETNPVLSRVGAYFHDIGKMKKPLYFVENQVPGENRHDKLSPSMSSLIIRSHVKDGFELGKKHKLPEPILDMITQHHGTSLIKYFYDKALKEAQESEDEVEVDVSLYSYPGPKPQSKEAGVLMLADGIEAAARTLPDHGVDKIQGLVNKMINKIFASGELNECDLTLADLHKIAKCFTHVLTGIYHQRVAYAEPGEKENGKSKDGRLKSGSFEVKKPETVKKQNEKAADKNGKKSQNGKNGKEDKKENKEDLKRLGL